MNAKNKGFIVLFPENSNCAYFVLNVVSSEMTKRNVSYKDVCLPLLCIFSPTLRTPLVKPTDKNAYEAT